MANIVIFHWRDYKHPELGGSTKNIVHVAEHLVSQGHAVKILTEKYSPELPDEEIFNGVTYIRRGKKLSQFVTSPLYFLRHQKNTTDLVIEAYDAWPYLTPLLHKNTLMLICHIQKEEWAMEFGALPGAILKVISSILLRAFYRNKEVIAISESTKESILHEGVKPKNISVIPVGIEEHMYTNAIPQKPSDRIQLSTPGRLKSHKQVDIAIELVANYNKTQRPPNGKFVYFDILGAGDHEPYLQELVRKREMTEYIKFYGKASDEVKAKLLAIAHLHPQFSKREGWGMTVIEAAAQGAPTVCFNIPGLIDSVTEETGYLVKSKDELFTRFPDIIAEIETNAEAYQNRVQKGFIFAQKFKWSEIYKQWDNLIERVLGVQAQQR